MGSVSDPFSVSFQRTTLLAFSTLKIMPASSSSLNLRDRTLGVNSGFERSSVLKRSIFLSPTSARMRRAHLRPSTPRSGFKGRAAKKFFWSETARVKDIPRDPIPSIYSLTRHKIIMLETEKRGNPQDNLMFVRHAWVDLLTAGNATEFASLHDQNVVMYDPTLPQPLKGRAALRDWAENLRRIFPDYKVREIRIFGQDDWVCLEAEETGTMKGPIHGPGSQSVPPTNKSFKIPSSIVCRVAGNIAEVRLYYDVLGLMAQLGLGPR